MSIVDDRGRLFGRFNLIDASVVAAVVLLLPVGYAAYALFRPPPLRITAVEPKRVVKGVATHVRLTGEHFRPYLRAEIGRLQPSRFLIETPTTGEFAMPDMEPGTYDVALFDEAEEVVRVKDAITVVAAAPPPTISMQLVGMFTNLDEATARTVKPGRRFPDRGDATFEVVTASAPIPDIRRIRMGTMIVDAPAAATWRVPAAVRVGCIFNFENQSCGFSGSPIVPGLALPVAGGVRFIVEEVRADAPGLPMEVTVRFMGRPEVLDLIKGGDVDRLADDGNGGRAARIVSMGNRQTVAGETLVKMTGGQPPIDVTTQTPDRVATVEAVIRLVAEAGPAGPTYRTNVLKPGSLFTFDAASYVVHGSVLRSARLAK